MRFAFVFLFIALVASLRAASDPGLIVFGATPAGIATAITAARDGRKVLLLEPGGLIGGMMAGGLTKTDLEKDKPYGGFTKEFFQRVVAYYTKAYGAGSQQVKDCDGGFAFEPSVAGKIFGDWLAESGVVVKTNEQLQSVEAPRGGIRALTTRNSATGAVTRHAADFFVDATYEGDLMARAGVLYRVGREARSEYNESLAGITRGPLEYRGKGDHRVQSYNIRGTLTNRPDIRLPIPKPDPYYWKENAWATRAIKNSGLTSIDQLFPYQRWALINGKGDPNKADFIGANFGYAEGDYEQRAVITKKVQDFWLSLWYLLQNDPEIPEAFRKDARQWGLPKDEFAESNHITPQVYVRVARRMLGRYLLTQDDLLYDRAKPDAIALGSYYIDSHVVENIQTDRGRQDEGQFDSTPDPYAIPYRSITPYGVKNLLVPVALSATHVAYSSLRMEPVFMMIGSAAGHAIDLAAKANSSVQDVSVSELQARLKKDGVPLDVPFTRPWVQIRQKTPGAIQPGMPVEFEIVEKDVKDPLAKFAWNFDGSGEVQATGRTATYTFPVAKNYTVSVLVEDSQGRKGLPATMDIPVGDEASASADIEVNFREAENPGVWGAYRSKEVEYRLGHGLVTQRNASAVNQAVFSATPVRTGRYRIAISFPTAEDRATNLPVSVTHAEGETKIALNQRDKKTPYAFVPIGNFRLEAGKPSVVTISNEGADGSVAIDNVRWIWMGE